MAPLLSILCQGRNDSYMGNFLYRLGTALNIHARNLTVLGVHEEVELLVTDWGSEVPLWKELHLSEEARRVVRFLDVPTPLARHYDQDSPFSGVHPTNAVARRARGDYLLFADSDVVIPLESMARLMHWVRKGSVGSRSLHEHFFWASKLHVPADLVATTPSVEALEAHIALHWPTYTYERLNTRDFGGGGVCLLMPRSVWWESRGWDERLRYWGWYDIDWHRRLKKRYQWDLLEEHGVRVFHLEHYKERFEAGAREEHNRQKPNPQREPDSYAPNPENWGLGDHDLTWRDGYGRTVPELGHVLPESAIDGTVCVRETLRRDTRYLDASSCEPSRDVPLTPIPPVLRKLLSVDIPKRVAIVSERSEGIEGIEIALLPGVESITWVDEWREDVVEGTPTVHSDSVGIFQRFLANLHGAGCGERVFPFRARSENAAHELAKRGAVFDLIYFASSSDLEGSRRMALAWMPLLAERGILYVVGGAFHCILNTCGPELHAMAKARDLYFIEIPSLCLILARDRCASIEPELAVLVQRALAGENKPKEEPVGPMRFSDYLAAASGVIRSS